jgi:hypothetical protein
MFSNRHLYIISAGLIFLLALIQVVQAQELRAIDVVPDNEKRSSIQAADGYAYLSENMTLGQTRAAAFANAKRQALESARTHIQSKTKVENFQLEYDLVMSDAEGTVTLLEQKDHGVEDNVRYHVWIKAEVEYHLRPKKVKSAQETIEIFIQGNKDFFARIVNIMPDGKIIQLLPNDYRPANFFLGGKVYRIPDKADKFNFKVAPPYGEENIVVYASEAPLGKVTMASIGQGLKQYKGQRKGLGFKTRGIKIEGTSMAFGTGAEFYESTWKLTTRD